MSSRPRFGFTLLRTLRTTVDVLIGRVPTYRKYVSFKLRLEKSHERTIAQTAHLKVKKKYGRCWTEESVFAENSKDFR